MAVEPEMRRAAADGEPFQIMVLGDFSGRAGANSAARCSPLRPISVDRENFEQLPARLGVGCDASIGDPEDHVVSLRFGRLDDFHPDRLFATVPLLARLKQLREKLLSPATFDKAAEEVRSWGLLRQASEPQRSARPPRESPGSAMPVSGGSLLDQAIGQTQQSKPVGEEARLPGELAELIRRSAEAIRVPKADPGQADLLACVDAAAGHVMRSVLHDPRFQALEAAWRALGLLVRRLPTGPRLKAFLVDVSLPELAADLGSAPQLEASEIYKLLVEQTVGTPGARPWAVIAGNYTFGATPVDLVLAGVLARIAAEAGAPLLAAASAELLGCQSLAATPDPGDWRQEVPERLRKTWEGIRAQPEASSLGLVLPRFLLRMPYGARSSPVEGFAFEEFPDPPGHEDFLWGNPALACAYLMGRAFHTSGWLARPQDCMEIDDLPAYVYEDGGEECLQSCGEALLSHRAAARILDTGLMPLLTVKGTGTARLAAWRSVASSKAGLSGWWL